MPFIRSADNLAGTAPWLGVNFWSRAGGPLMWRAYDDGVVRAELATLAENEIFLTRSFLLWPDFQPAPDVVDEAFMERFGRFLQAHEDLGMRTVPTMLVGHMSGQNFDLPWRAGRDLYRDGAMLGQQAFFIREVVRRAGASPAVAGWLLSNEFPHYAGSAPREYVRAWALTCANAVRAGGSWLPVGLGDGAWGADMTGADNGYVLDDQMDVVDFIGPHVYASDDDQARQLSRAAVASELAGTGKPVVLEEFGLSSALTSDANAAHYYRLALHLSLLGGATGWLAWNNTDFDLLDQEPYCHHAHELGFGLTTAEGRAKPAMAEMRAFSLLLKALDVAHCRRAPTRTAVLVPAYLSARHQFMDGADRQDMLPITHHAYLAAKRAGLAPALVRQGGDLPGDGLLIVPSAKSLPARSFEDFAKLATDGLHIYLSWFAGTGAGMKGAWWPPLEPLFGATHGLGFGLADLAPAALGLTVQTAFGSLRPGDQVTAVPAGPHWGRAYLPLQVVADDVEVLLSDEAGGPMLIRRRLGRGAVYLGACPLEFWGCVRPDANLDDPVWRIYRALAEEAGAVGPISGQNPDVVVDTMERADGQTYVWLVNMSSRRQPCGVRLPEGSRLVGVGTEETIGTDRALGPFEVLVGRVATPSPGGRGPIKPREDL